MNNFYGTHLGNHSRPFSIRRKKLLTAPPSGYSTLTSVPVCKKTSLSWKQCMLQMKFLLISFRKMLFPTKICHWEQYTAPPSGSITETSFRLADKNIIMSETVNDRQNLSDEHYYEVGIVLPNSVCENYWKHPLAVERRWHHSYSARKFHCLGNGALLR